MLSIVIPAYNEEKRIPRCLELTINFLKKQTFESEIIVVLDGCTDNSRSITESFRKEFSALKIIDYKPNKGKGFAVKTGMLEANYEIRMFMDADYAVPIETLPKYIEKINEGNDLIIASRRHKDSVIEKHQMILRELAGKGFGLLQKIILGIPFYDTQCGFKLFTKEAAEYLFPQLQYNCSYFDAEMMYVAYQAKMKVAEMPVKWTHDGMTSMPIGSSRTVDLLKKLFRLKGLHKNIPEWNGGIKNMSL
jgi:glycosyltransferase involved in cell wall biosynthesis